MIVDPDFLDHWKTRMLVGLLGNDECAPLYVLRLWSHCQHRRQSEFTTLPPEALKAICRFPGSPKSIDDAFVASGFISREGAKTTVVGWAEYNAALMASWSNGKRGGRPPSLPKPRDNPRVCDRNRGEENSSQFNDSAIHGSEVLDQASFVSAVRSACQTLQAKRNRKAVAFVARAMLTTIACLGDDQWTTALHDASNATGERSAYLRRVLQRAFTARGSDFEAAYARHRLSNSEIDQVLNGHDPKTPSADE